MKFLWSTDTHLDFLSDKKLESFIDSIVRTCKADKEIKFFCITGDIANGKNVFQRTEKIREALVDTCPFHFVLGNHDFYGSSVREVVSQFQKAEDARAITETDSYRPSYLGDGGIVTYEEEDQIYVVFGFNGNADGLYQCPMDSEYVKMMNDFYMIEEYIFPSSANPRRPDRVYNFEDVLYRTHIKQKMIELALVNVKAAYGKIYYFLRSKVGFTDYPDGFKKYSKDEKKVNVIVLTHIPPFTQLNNSVKHGVAGIPFYTSKLAGDMLKSLAVDFKTVNFHVFCGHVHDKMEHQERDNLIARTQAAIYGFPCLETVKIVDIPKLPPVVDSPDDADEIRRFLEIAGLGVSKNVE